jgi:hypothetical protein
MARYQTKDSYNDVMILADTDTAIPLPNPLAGGGPLALGTEFDVVDNLLTAAAHNIVVSGPIAGASGTATINANGGSLSFIWMGNAYCLGTS